MYFMEGNLAYTRMGSKSDDALRHMAKRSRYELVERGDPKTARAQNCLVEDLKVLRSLTRDKDTLL